MKHDSNRVTQPFQRMNKWSEVMSEENLMPPVFWLFTRLYSGGDEGLGEAGAECGVLLPDRECDFMQHSSLQSDHSDAVSGPSGGQRRTRPTHIQPHPAQQEEDRTEDTSRCWFCRLPLGHQGGKSRHVRMKIKKDNHLRQHLCFIGALVSGSSAWY